MQILEGLNIKSPTTLVCKQEKSLWNTLNIMCLVPKI